MVLPEDIVKQCKEALDNVSHKIFIDVIVDQNNMTQDMYDAQELVDSVSGIIDQVVVNKIDIHSQDAKKHYVTIEDTPAIVIYNEGQKASFVYFGVPSGYEFSSFIEILRTTGNHQADLSDSILNKLKEVNKNIPIQIFVTPSCPHCPPMVVAGFRISYVNSLITVYVYDAKVFRTKARAQGVMGVPKTIINNGEYALDGNVPIDTFVDHLLK